MGSTLLWNESLGLHEKLTSPNGENEVLLGGDGNLVLYVPSGPIWATNTANQGYTELKVMSGGLVLIRPGTSLALYFSPDCLNATDLRLKVQNDGNLVLYKGMDPRWSTGTDNCECYCCKVYAEGTELVLGKIQYGARNTGEAFGKCFEFADDLNIPHSEFAVTEGACHVDVDGEPRPPAPYTLREANVVGVGRIKPAVDKRRPS